MFEKDAEYYAFDEVNHKQEWYIKHPEHSIDYDYEDIKKHWEKGAEFGYNKANEWHYPSKGELPKEDKRYLCKIKAFVGSGITYECFDYDSEYSSWKGASGEVIAWKEIVLPKESE